MMILAETSVAPTVGEDAIQAGKVAAVMGFLLVAIFMFIYYRYCGLVANIALVLDVALMPLGLIVASSVLGVFVKDADKLYVIKDGNIDSSGTHQELLEKGGLYKSMWQAHISAKDSEEDA